jgi:hypothetical protein
MEYFYGGGGRSNPDFTYRFLCKEITNEMWQWCENYPLTGPFERWYVQHNYKASFTSPSAAKDEKEVPLIQFESSKAAYMFSIAYSEYIIEDLTYSFARKYNESFNR